MCGALNLKQRIDFWSKEPFLTPGSRSWSRGATSGAEEPELERGAKNGMGEPQVDEPGGASNSKAIPSIG